MRFRYLFCPWPTRGDLHPLLAVASELRQRGHDVRFFSSPTIRSEVTRNGFAWLPAPREPRPLDPRPGRTSGARHHLLTPLRGQLDALAAAVDSFAPDVLVDGILPLAPRLLAEARGLLHASICTVACPLPSEELFPYGLGLPPPRDALEAALARSARARQRSALAAETAEWNGVRRELGLPGDGEHPWLSLPSRHLIILPTTPELEYPRGDLPGHAHFVGPLSWRGGAQREVPREVGRLCRERPLLYVSQGTFFTMDYPLIRLAFEALGDQPVALAVSTGRRVRAGELGDVPANAVVRRSFCLWKLFRRAKAAVVHGGLGSVNEALAAGIPLVILPLAADQPEVAQRCVRAGAAISLELSGCAPARLREAVREVLGNPVYGERAREAAAAGDAHGGAAAAAALLERLARHRRPVERPTR